MADPFALLELDHRHVEALLEQLAESEEGPERERLVSDLEESLTEHMSFEEGAIYPFLVAKIDAESAQDAETEHSLARDGLAEVRQLVAEPGFGGAVEALKGDITHHVEEEESEIFPKLREAMDPRVRDGLATGMRVAKRAAGLPVVPPEADRDQLMQIACDLGIEGLRAMDRDEIETAISQSS